MSTFKQSLIFILSFALAQTLATGIAAEYPSRPIEMIIPYDAGASSDLIGRRLAEIAQKFLEVRIIIVNKPGGTGATGYTYIHNSKPDGYTIGLATSTLVAHKIFGNCPIDHHDVEVVILTDGEPLLLFVPTNSKYQTLEDIIADAKQNPGKIKWGTSSGNLLLCSEGIFRTAGIDVKVIPSSKSGAQPIIQAIGGHVDMAFTGLLGAQSPIAANLLRPIAMYTNERVDQFPDVPTFAEYGYPIRFRHVRGIITPPGVEKNKLEILNDAFRKAVESEEFKEFCDKNSSEIIGASFQDADAILSGLEKDFKETQREM